MTLLVEAPLGAFLLIGLATRFWALAGAAHTVVITLSVLRAPNEWHWSYFLSGPRHPHLMVVLQVPGDRVRTGVQALLGQLLTNADDQLDGIGAECGR
jgi:hypothetical protein